MSFCVCFARNYSISLPNLIHSALHSNPHQTAAFRPQSGQLKTAVTECITNSPNGDCSKGAHGSIGDWDVSAITDMGELFITAHFFDQDLSKWDMSAVTNMYGMFYHALAFNKDVSKWDVSAVTNTEVMFSDAHAFNQDMSKWDVSAVTDMRGMFSYAHAFNQDLSKWDVSAVTSMVNMFFGAKSFKRELCGNAWVESEADKSYMFTDSPGSISSTACEGYDYGGGYA